MTPPAGRGITNVYFVRHGETDLNRQKIIQGRCDTHGLNENGRAQAEGLAALISGRGLRGDHVLSSELKRARQTAELVARTLGQTVQIVPDLAEMDFGPWEGKAVDEIRARVFDPPLAFDGFTVADGKTLRAFHKSTDPLYDCLAHPGGESKAQVRERVAGAVFSFLEENSDAQDIWVVTHGVAMRVIMSHYASPALAAGGADHAEIAHFIYDANAPRKLEWRGRITA